jgi:predicted PurR-regulated permease PerM
MRDVPEVDRAGTTTGMDAGGGGGNNAEEDRTDAGSEAREARGEASDARGEASEARGEASDARGEASEARAEATEARDEATDARAEASQARAEATEARDEAVEARDEATQARAQAAEASADPAHDPLLDTAVRQQLAGVDARHPFGRPGRPVGERSPFRLALLASIGVGAAYELVRAVVQVREVLLLGLFALVLAIGLDPAVGWLSRRMRRGFAVLVVLLAVLGLFGGFLAAAVPPLSSQATALVKEAPDYLQRLAHDNASLGHLNARYHMVAALRKHTAGGSLSVGVSISGGFVGVGKALLSVGAALVATIVLLVYFLASLPDLKRSAYRFIPRSRRARMGVVTDEILARVGAWMIGNFATSALAGLATGLFLFAAGVPYPIALGLFVAVADLVPLVGMAVATIGVALVAFLTSLPLGFATLVFLGLYQALERLVVMPRLHRSEHIKPSPLLTIGAAVAGGALAGVLGVLVAIPLAAGGQLLVSEVLYPRQQRH